MTANREANANSFLIQYEDFESQECHAVLDAVSAHLNIPEQAYNTEDCNQLKTTGWYEGQLQGDTSAIAWRLGYKLSRIGTTTNSLFINANAISGALEWL